MTPEKAKKTILLFTLHFLYNAIVGYLIVIIPLALLAESELIIGIVFILSASVGWFFKLGDRIFDLLAYCGLEKIE